MSIVKQLADTRCFIMARLQPKADGGTDKIPTNPTTGYDSNAQDASTWLTGAEAEYYASQWNAIKQAPVIEYGVGIMIAEGRFCIDLDHCREGDGWQPHAMAFVSRFPGAAVEVSASMAGLHIMGFATDFPVHGTRNKHYRMEAYTKERFIYITGLGAYGDVRTDCTESLKRFLADFFPAHDHGSAEWSSGPVAAWRGPVDDNELISRALRAQSAKSIFDGKASFRDLWVGDASVLARTFPPQSIGKSYDGSAADQALFNHLAFWTGNDCERMVRLANASGLKRDKWQRADYLQGTVMRACGDQREWYNGPDSAPSGSQPEMAVTIPLTGGGAGITVPPPPIETPSLPSGVPAPPPMPATSYSLDNLPPPGEYVNVFMQQQIFLGMCYVRDIHKVQMPDGSAWAQKQFDVVMGHRKWAIEADGTKPGNAWDAFTNSQIANFPKVLTQYFGPKEETGTIREIDGHLEINCYKPAIIRRIPGDATPFLELLTKMLPNEVDRTILLSWMASAVRNLGVKFMYWPFLQGTKGNGKTTIAKILEYCFSQRYTHWPKSSELNEKFNSVFVDKLLLIVDETKTQDQVELQEILKIMVTTTRLEVRPMYAEKMMKEICFNGFLISNHKNGVRIDKDERRFAPFYCAQQEKEHNARDGLTSDYFVTQLLPWLKADGFAICYDYLMTYDIAAEYDPAGACVVAPVTSSTEEAITASLGGIEQELLSAIEQKQEGFRNGWIRSVEVDHLLARIGKDKAIPPQARKSLVLSLGYMLHPSLSDGLCQVTWPDGTIPRLYVAKGHAWAVDYLSPDIVRDGYLAAQRGQ